MTDLKVEFDSVTVCRICLQGSDDEDDEMASIFDRDTDSKLFIFEKIEKCGGIKILNDPELPTRICRKCRAFLAIAHKFRVICKNSDNYLREFVCKATSARNTEDFENGIPEYLTEYNPETNTTQVVAQILLPAGHELDETQTDDLDEDQYTEWQHDEVDGDDQEPEHDDHEHDVQDVQDEHDHDHDDHDEHDEHDEHDDHEEDDDDDDIIEEELSSQGHSPSPSKTLGISPDGTAVIRVKSDRQLIKEKQMHICDVCGNSYPRKYALEAHMRRHRNERPFECEICHQSFHLNFQLTRHIRKHTGLRPYICQYCNRSFADRSTMVKHERIHRNERPYRCETCGKSFTYSSVLKVHMLTHTGEKPFHCGLCGKRFARSHHLRAHLETQMHQNDPRSKVLLRRIKREEDEAKEAKNEYVNI